MHYVVFTRADCPQDSSTDIPPDSPLKCPLFVVESVLVSGMRRTVSQTHHRY